MKNLSITSQYMQECPIIIMLFSSLSDIPIGVETSLLKGSAVTALSGSSLFLDLVLFHRLFEESC